MELKGYPVHLASHSTTLDVAEQQVPALPALEIIHSQKLQLKSLPDLRWLDYEHIGSLEICSDTAAPDRLTAWFADEPGRLGQWLGAVCGAASGTTDAFHPLVESWIHRAVGQAGILAALTELAANPEDIASIWRLRCALLSACIEHADTEVSASIGDMPWFWGFDPRTNPAVWLQDLALLQACEEFPAATNTLLSMTRQGRIAPVWALARALSDRSAGATERKDLWRGWLRGSLEQLDLRVGVDAPLVRGVLPKPPPANMGWIGRMAHAAKHKHVPSLLPDLARMIRKIDPQGMSETLARKMVDQIPDAGDLLIEVGLDFHKAGASGARLLLATGLGSAENLTEGVRAEVTAALLAARVQD